MKCIVLTVALLMLSLFNKELFSQFDGGDTYSTKGFSLKSSGIEKNNISELKFLSDSLIRIKTSLYGTSEKIAFESVNSMSFRTGSYG